MTFVSTPAVRSSANVGIAIDHCRQRQTKPCGRRIRVVTGAHSEAAHQQTNLADWTVSVLRQSELKIDVRRTDRHAQKRALGAHLAEKLERVASEPRRF